jgi:hypothetical protein
MNVFTSLNILFSNVCVALYAYSVQCRNYKIGGPCVVIILGPFLGFIFVVRLIHKYQFFLGFKTRFTSVSDAHQIFIFALSQE